MNTDRARLLHFQEPFRGAIRRGVTTFPDRARWLQALSRCSPFGKLFADLAASATSNIQGTFASTDAAAIKVAADAFVQARQAFILGIGANQALARNFAYTADMAVDNITAIPRDGSLAVDDISRANFKDLLIALTFMPYRNDVLEAVELARAVGIKVVGISDSPALLIAAGNQHRFVVQTETPQFYISTIAAGAFLRRLWLSWIPK